MRQLYAWALIFTLGMVATSASADLITSTVEYVPAADSPDSGGDSSQTVLDPGVGATTNASVPVPEGSSTALQAQQAFTGSGAKGYVTAGSVFVNGKGRNFLTATNVLELDVTTAGEYDFTFLITGGVLRLADYANPSFPFDIPEAGFSAEVRVLSGAGSSLEYFTSASYTLDGSGGETLTVVGPDISASDFGNVGGAGDYNVDGRSVPTFSPTVSLGLLAAGDVVQYTLTAMGSGRGNETGFLALVNDPNDLSDPSIVGASLTPTGGGPPPVPEPATALLFGSAGGAFLLARRRRRQCS